MQEPSKGVARKIREGRSWAYGRWVTDRCNPVKVIYLGQAEIKAVAETSNFLRRLTAAR